MSGTCMIDVFSSLDSFASHTGNWGGYWGMPIVGVVLHATVRQRTDHPASSSKAEFDQLCS